MAVKLWALTAAQYSNYRSRQWNRHWFVQMTGGQPLRIINPRGWKVHWLAARAVHKVLRWPHNETGPPQPGWLERPCLYTGGLSDLELRLRHPWSSNSRRATTKHQKLQSGCPFSFMCHLPCGPFATCGRRAASSVPRRRRAHSVTGRVRTPAGSLSGPRWSSGPRLWTNPGNSGFPGRR